MKLIRLLVAVIAMTLVFGAGAATASAKPSIAKQAKQKCKKKKGKAKKNCVKKQVKRLKAKAKRERQRERKHPRVTIRTTEYGIPRIVADNYRGLGYGYGYELAKENICSMAEITTTNRGQRSKYFGPDGEWMLTGNQIPFTNLEADFAHKRVIADKTVEKLLKAKPPLGPKPQVSQVVDGYVKGYNRWLKQTGVNKIQDRTCRGKPWVKPITKMDAYRRFFELGTMAGLGAAVDGIANAAPPATPAEAKAAARASASVSAEDLEKLNETNPDIGSNAVALGSEATSTGKGMLLGNPHFPWSGSERFFQGQVTIPGKINVSGASLLGAPVVLIGHTRNLAWSHTVSTSRHFAFVREQLVPGNPTSYVVDGRTKKMHSVDVTVQVKQPDGSLKSETRTLYSTIHGPIVNSVQKQPLFGWTNTQAFAMRDPNSDGLRFINHFFDVDRSQSVPQLVKALKRNQGIPWVNTIAADSKGNALYSDIDVVPNLTDARVAECKFPGPINDLAWTTNKLAVLDGSKSSCDLKKAPGAVVKGILPPSEQPTLIRKDYVTNSNDSYWLSNPESPIEGIPSIMGAERTTRSLRTRNGLVQIEQQLANGGKFNLKRVQGFINNNRNYGAELLTDDLVAYCKAHPSINGVDVSGACGVLAGWDKTEGLDSPGSVLWREVMNGMPDDMYVTPFDANDPVHTPSGLKVSNPDVPKALSDAVTSLNGFGIPMDATYRDYQYVTRNGEKIPIPGGSGFQGVFNVITASRNKDTGKYDDVMHGSSFIQAASMTGAKCPPVKTILTYSQAATNVKSKHYADQTKLFSAGKWVNDRFCLNQQKKSPDLQVKNLNGGAKAVKKGF